jgi:hypothetical protein
MSEEQVRRLLTEDGYKVTRVRLLSRAEVETRRRRTERYRRYEFTRRLIRQGLRSGAQALRFSIQAGGPWAGHLRMDLLVNGKWVVGGRMATGAGQGLSPREMDGHDLWDLARRQVAAAMGLGDVPTSPRYRGEMGFRWKGRDVRMRVSITPKTVRLDALS